MGGVKGRRGAWGGGRVRMLGSFKSNSARKMEEGMVGFC